MSSVVGTPYYLAPEVLSKSYGKECDVWSIGVLMYVMLTALMPFSGGTHAELFAHIKNG